MMTESELIAEVARRSGLSKKQAKLVVEAIIATITSSLAKGKIVRIAKFGTFHLKRRAKRVGRNPKTGAMIVVPASDTPRFRAAAALTSAVQQQSPKDTMGRESSANTASDRHSMSKRQDSAGDRASKTGLAITAENNAVLVPVHFATNRKVTGRNVPNYFFGSERTDDTLHYGRLVVSIPISHRIGLLERPTVWRLWRENTSKHVVLRNVSLSTPTEFFSNVQNELTQLEHRRAFVFIHGFNVTFAAAARRAAQMAYDLFLARNDGAHVQLAVAPILFSWPSNGRVLRYFHDENNADASAEFLKSFIGDMAKRVNADSITIMAHSMGNRALITALKEIGLAMRGEDGPILREIILAAPDIDRTVFAHAAEAVMRTGHRVTLYASSRDKALRASITANGFPRAGDSTNGVVVIEGMDSIDASVVGQDLLAHSYYGEPSLLTDLHSIILRGDPPAKRFGLQPEGDPPEFWKIRARA